MDPELQKKVLENLDYSGFLHQMRASFRSKIFESLIASDKSLLPFPSKPKELDTDIGKIASALIADFLDQFNLSLSKKMMKTEAHIEESPQSIRDLEESLEKRSTKRNPLIFEIIKQMFVEDQEIPEDISPESDSIERNPDNLVESAGTSQGYDQSVNSLAMEEFDYVEMVRR